MSDIVRGYITQQSDRNQKLLFQSTPHRNAVIIVCGTAKKAQCFRLRNIIAFSFFFVIVKLSVFNSRIQVLVLLYHEQLHFITRICMGTTAHSVYVYRAISVAVFIVEWKISCVEKNIQIPPQVCLCYLNLHGRWYIWYGG